MPGNTGGGNTDVGRDLIDGDIGHNASRVALGEGIQQMFVSLSESGHRPDSETWRRLIEIVLGDGVAWDGVMHDLRRLRESVQNLTNKVTTLENKVSELKTEIDGRRETSGQILWMLRLLLVLALVMAAVYMLRTWG